MPAATFDIVKSAGQSFTDSDTFKKLAGDMKGTARMTFKSVTMNAAVTNITSNTTGTGGAGNAIAPDRLSGIITPPNRRMTVRDLLLPGRTSSNLLQFVQETGFQNMAAMVAEGGAKPQSDLSLDLVDTPVRTLAHWIKASNQVLADVPQLQSYIDGRLRYGLQYVEEQELLAGDGTAQHLLGLIPQSTPFDVSLLKADDQQVDVLASCHPSGSHRGVCRIRHCAQSDRLGRHRDTEGLQRPLSVRQPRPELAAHNVGPAGCRHQRDAVRSFHGRCVQHGGTGVRS